MNRLKCPEYIADVDKVCSLPLPWEKLANKTVVISGATGLIGTFLVDVLMRKNDIDGARCSVIALGRNIEKARSRLPYFGRDHFSFEEGSVAAIGYKIGRAHV